jgi:hypothetical protein
MEKIDILIYNDNLHRPLFDIFFKPSFDEHLSKSFNLIDILYRTDETDGNYASSHWSNVIINRFDILKEYIVKNVSDNKIAIFSDIDIIFLDNIYIDVVNKFKEDIDICYMPENSFSPNFMINGGFFAFRCSPTVLDFFSIIQDLTKNSTIKNDQPIIQEYLKKATSYNSNIRYSRFSPIHYCTNNNPKYINHKILGTAKVFHATSATNLIEKSQVLSSFILHKKLLSDQTLLVDKNLWL